MKHIRYAGEAHRRSDEVRKQHKNKKGMATGGRVHAYPKFDEGSLSGEGRLAKIAAYGNRAHEKS